MGLERDSVPQLHEDQVVVELVQPLEDEDGRGPGLAVFWMTLSGSAEIFLPLLVGAVLDWTEMTLTSASTGVTRIRDASGTLMTPGL